MNDPIGKAFGGRMKTSSCGNRPPIGRSTKRKLAAILAADIAGYSRLMGADEEGTLTRLKVLRRELIDPKNKQHRGRIVSEDTRPTSRSRSQGAKASFGPRSTP